MPTPHKSRTPALRTWWRVTKTMQPGERGAVRLLRAYGDQLVCVRYRTSGSGEERLTTVELVIDRTMVRRRGHQIVAFKIKDSEEKLRREALKLGAWFNAATGLWNPSLERGPPPAWHLAREAVVLIIGLAGQAPSRLRPLSSNVRRQYWGGAGYLTDLNLPRPRSSQDEYQPSHLCRSSSQDCQSKALGQGASRRRAREAT